MGKRFVVQERGRYVNDKNGYRFAAKKDAITFAQAAARGGAEVYVWDCTDNRAFLKLFNRREPTWV